MKGKLKEIVPIFIIAYCLIIIPIVLYKYNFYLEKPDAYAWEEVRKYFANSEKYNQEPIVFNPGWFKNYATDYGRFKKLNVAKSTDSFDNYWLVSMDKKSIPKNYQIIVVDKVKDLFIFKFARLNTAKR